MDIRWFSPGGGVASRPGEDDDTLPGASTAADEDKQSVADTESVKDESREHELERSSENTNDPPADNSNQSTTNIDQGRLVHLHRHGRQL